MFRKNWDILPIGFIKFKKHLKVKNFYLVEILKICWRTMQIGLKNYSYLSSIRAKLHGEKTRKFIKA